MLLSEVATNYIQMRTYEQRLAYARENVQIQKRSLELAETRFRTDGETELDVRQAVRVCHRPRPLIPPLVAGRRQANPVCTLLVCP